VLFRKARSGILGLPIQSVIRLSTKRFNAAAEQMQSAGFADVERYS
jgi:hypothetical protein